MKQNTPYWGGGGSVNVPFLKEGSARGSELRPPHLTRGYNAEFCALLLVRDRGRNLSELSCTLEPMARLKYL